MAQLRESIRLDVRRCMASLQAASCPAIDVAYLMKVSRSTLYRWRSGEELPDPVQLEQLRALTAQVTRRVG
jgi:hypothetical protein